MGQQHIPIQIHNDTLACLRHYLTIAALFFNHSFDEPSILYRKKGSIAGSALLQKWQIQLNLNMLMENKDVFIQEVIPHELAHLIAYKEFGRVKPHGIEWQTIMSNVFKCKPQRTHSFSLPQTTMQQRHHYGCQCQDHFLTSIRHNKILKNKTQYYCKNCGTLLQLK